jgi:hypothetical protein
MSSLYYREAPSVFATPLLENEAPWFLGYGSRGRRPVHAFFGFSRNEHIHLFVAAFFFFSLTCALVAGTLFVVQVRHLAARFPLSLALFFEPRPARAAYAFTGDGASFNDLITREAMRQNIDPLLVKAIIKVESNFYPQAVSIKGAQGLMQLMPETATQADVFDSFNPEDNVRGGTAHLRELLDVFGGDLALSLAAYNAGRGAVIYYRGIPPFAETQAYVPRVLHVYEAYKNQ